MKQESEDFNQRTLRPTYAAGFGRAPAAGFHRPERHCRQAGNLQKIFGADCGNSEQNRHFANQSGLSGWLQAGQAAGALHSGQYSAANGRQPFPRGLLGS